MTYQPQHAAAKADPSRPWKAIAAAALAVAIAVVQVAMNAWADDQWSREDTFVTVLAFLSAVAVYLTPNPIIPDPADDTWPDDDGPEFPNPGRPV